MAVALAMGVCATVGSTTEAARSGLSQANDAVLKTHLLVTWYGNPNNPRMGVLGRYTGTELSEGLRTQASAYQGLTSKAVIAGYELVAVVAQDPSWARWDVATPRVVRGHRLAVATGTRERLHTGAEKVEALEPDAAALEVGDPPARIRPPRRRNAGTPRVCRRRVPGSPAPPPHAAE
jgi:hypothetical protein